MFALESNPDLSFAQGTQCREKRSGTGPTSLAVLEKVRRRSARLAFSSLGDRATGGVRFRTFA